MRGGWEGRRCGPSDIRSGALLSTQRCGAQEVVPPTGHTHLDEITAVVARFGGQAFEFLGGVDRSALFREPRTEDEPDMAERPNRTHGARRRSSLRVVAADSQEFDLGIAHVDRVDLASLHRAQQPTSIESIVDRAGVSTGSARAARVGELHVREITDRPPTGQCVGCEEAEDP